MARVKGGTTAAKRRRNILGAVTGYRFDRGSKKRAAREAIYHAQLHAFDHRRDKKGDFRRLWIARVGAAVRAHGMSYSALIRALSEKNIGINRKMLATIAQTRPAAFERIIKHVR